MISQTTSEGDEEVMFNVVMEARDWNFEGLLKVEELKCTGI